MKKFSVILLLALGLAGCADDQVPYPDTDNCRVSLGPAVDRKAVCYQATQASAASTQVYYARIQADALSTLAAKGED